VLCATATANTNTDKPVPAAAAAAFSRVKSSIAVLKHRKMASEAPPYKDPAQPVDARVEDLLSRMTLQEKAAQMAQIERRVATPTALRNLSIGSVLSAGGSPPRHGATAEEWANMVDQMQRWAVASRLGIPIIYGSDAVHGHNNLFGATIFPHNIALGAARFSLLLHSFGSL
jgi:beta-glucosidase